MQVQIREADPGDYSAIYSLIKNELGYDPLDYDRLCDRLNRIKEDSKQMTIVALYAGKVAGFMGINKYTSYNYEGDYLQITAIAVSKANQNKGIGIQLTMWAEQYAKENNMAAIVLTSRLHREKAHAFYEHRGFIKASFGFRKDV